MESSRINPFKLRVVTFLKCVLCCSVVRDFPEVTACCMQGTLSKADSITQLGPSWARVLKTPNNEDIKSERLMA